MNWWRLLSAGLDHMPGFLAPPQAPPLPHGFGLRDGETLSSPRQQMPRLKSRSHPTGNVELDPVTGRVIPKQSEL